MEHNNTDKVAVDVKAKSRRKFIQKASAASLIAVIPAKTTWATNSGCTVSGNLSGNLSQPCTTNTVTINGMDPSMWKNVYDRDHSQYRSENVPFASSGGPPKWGDIFGMSRPPFNGAGSGNTTIIEYLPEQDQGGRGGRFASSTINQHLVAAFLNAYTGRYPLEPGVDGYSYVHSLYDLVDNGTYLDSDMIAAIQQTY